MFLFGHLGIGSKLASPFSQGLARKSIWIGTLLPDIIDKPLYYGLSFFTGKKGQALGLISGTRTFGHTALFLLSLSFLAFFRKSRTLAALALGTGSHLLLDSIPNAAHCPLLWPLQGWEFPVTPFVGIVDQLSIWNRPSLVWGECLGFVLICWDQWTLRRLRQISLKHKRH